MNPKNEHNRKYILENCEQLTATEMASFLGISYGRVKELCGLLGVNSITKEERHKKFIKENPGYTKEGYCEILGISKAAILKYEEQLGISIPTNKQAEAMTDHEPEENKEPDNETVFTPQQQRGLLVIAESIFEDMTDEQKKIFAERYVAKRRIPGVIRSDYL